MAWYSVALAAIKEIVVIAAPRLKEIGVALLVEGAKKVKDWLLRDDKPIITQPLPQNPTISDLAEIREQLSLYLNPALSRAEELAKSLASGIRADIAEFAKLFDPFDKSVGAEMSAEFSGFFEKAKSAFVQNISSKISLGNNDFLGLLQQEQNEQNIGKFIKAVNENALKAFHKELEFALSSIFAKARQKLDTPLLVAQRAMELKESSLMDIKNTTDKAGKEKKQAELALTIAKLEAVKRALQG